MLMIKTVKRGRLHGMARSCYDNGQIKREDPFHKGRLHGPQRTWYADGQIKSEVHYTNGCLDGRKHDWYPDGRLKSECFYRMKKLEGPLLEWYPNGLIQEQGNYLESKRHGIWKEYDDNGSLLSKQLYIRGVRFNGKIQRLLNSGRLSAKHILKMQNTAVRRICLEEFGYGRFLMDVEHEIIDQDRSHELARVNWNTDEEPLYLVKVKCPSTGAFYTLRVPPDVRTVRQAVAWTFGLSGHEYQPEEES